MSSIRWSSYARDHPLVALFAIFCGWKSLIIFIVLISPGVGYDTSTSLLSPERIGQDVVFDTPRFMHDPWMKFVRWDAIYYTHMAEQGHIFEQEWAFGIGLSSTISWISKQLSSLGLLNGQSSLMAGILLSHTAHWLSVVQLWALATALVADRSSDFAIPFCAAALHTFSPAGVFLCAPYSESTFAFLSMSGFLGYSHAIQYFHRGQAFRGCTAMVGAGLSFGIASIVRGNGILAGIPYLIEAIAAGLAILLQGFTMTRFSRLVSVIVGGMFVGIGMLIPQVLGYREYCLGRNAGARRPWCELTVPSIFSWVQTHYWNVGPFRYWTVSNIPLFLLAAPTLLLLAYSAIKVMQNPQSILANASKGTTGQVSLQKRTVVMGLALPQLVLAILAFTSYHVQIITRLSSGYPLWSIWLAARIHDQPKRVSSIIRWMVVYALIQAGLYACFLPPA